MTRAALGPGLHSCRPCPQPQWQLADRPSPTQVPHRHLSMSSAGAQWVLLPPPKADSPRKDRSVTWQPSKCLLLSARLLSACVLMNFLGGVSLSALGRCMCFSLHPRLYCSKLRKDN